MRDQINRFFAQHTVAWELATAALAILYVAIGFGQDSTTTSQPTLQIAELAVTWTFITEFTVRIRPVETGAATCGTMCST